MTRYSIEPRAKRYVKGYGFSWNGENIENNYYIQESML